MRAVVILGAATAAGLVLVAARPAAFARPSLQRGAGSVGGGTVCGTVEETIDASNYTYLRLKTAAGEVWAAVNKVSVKTGARVTVVNAVPMDGFESKTLHRKFEHIVFGTLASSETGAASPGTGKSPALPPGHLVKSDVGAGPHAAAAAAPSRADPSR